MGELSQQADPLGRASRRRWFVLPACLLMLACIGTGQAWSVFVEPLRHTYGLTSLQTQLVFSTSTLVFCTWIIPAGRLHDRFGPRLVALAGAVILGAAYLTTALAGGNFAYLWLGMGLLGGVGIATIYTCPIATAIKWFPHHRGLVAGIAAAAFAAGPILVQHVATPLLAAGWPVLRVIGRLGAVYVPVLLVGALLLVTPAPPAARHARARFRVRALLADPRFWPLFVGMLCGTLPYLVLIGNIRPIAGAWQVGAAVGLAIPALALGNATGRVFWGAVVDRAGTRATVRAAQITAVVAVALVPFTGGRAWLFLPALAGVGFCYGSNFAIYPATIARVYGVEWLGSVYPWVMLAQGVSSFGPAIAGLLNDRTGRLTCGMALAAAVAVTGLVSGILLGRRQRET